MDDVQRQFERNDNEHKTIMDKMEAIKNDFLNETNDIKVLIAGLPKKLQDEFDKRYASKETEKTVNRVQWLIISTVILAVIGFVLGEKYFR